MSAIHLGKITKHRGVAGQISYSVVVTFADDEDGPKTMTFVGSIYGGPVVMVTPSGYQTFVSDPSRFGPFGPQWVRNFYA